MEKELLKESRILIVDDKEANIEILEELLVLEGYQNIESTVDPRMVINLFRTFNPDLILLDLMMPFIDGFEVMELLREAAPKEKYLSILVLTADTSDETKKKALSNGATDFLSKPFDLVEVGLRIKNILYVSYLHKQLLNQNSVLEEKVKERTEELRLQNTELKAAWKKAEASDRLKTSFINNISHEIRTPLNGIIGFTQLVSEPDIPNEEKEKYIEIISESGNRLINTVTDFLDVSLLKSGNVEVKLSEVSAEIIVKEIIEKFEKICITKGLELEIRLEQPAKDGVFRTDELLVKKILSHLVDNAIKFTQQGKVAIGAKKLHGDLCFFVEDTGIGISKESKKDIFHEFIQEELGTTRNYEGSGLGLSISKGFAELLGGKIWFEESSKKGTTFYFTVPLTNNEGQNKKADEHLKLQTKTKILIVEDDDINFEYISILLTNKYVELIRAIDGINAVEVIQQQRDVKIVLMDLILPGQDGFEATRRIKEIDRNISVLAVTALSFTEHRQKAFEAGCDEFIIKPLKKTELYEKLKKYNVYL